MAVKGVANAATIVGSAESGRRAAQREALRARLQGVARRLEHGEV
jgi:hypothetical protein